MLLVNGRAADGVPYQLAAGLLDGTNVFEVARTYGRRFFRLRRHLDRLRESAAWMGIEYPGHQLLEEEALRVAGENSAVRITLAQGLRLVHCRPVELGRVGRPLRVATLVQPPTEHLPGRVKHGSRAAWFAAVRRTGADEALLVSPGGEVLELSRSNVFAVVRGRLHTPPLDGRQLEGVTRGAVVDAARMAGVEVVEAPLRLADQPCDELWGCSTLKELVPISEIDGRPAPGAGPVGARVYAAFRALVDRETARSAL